MGHLLRKLSSGSDFDEEVQRLWLDPSIVEGGGYLEVGRKAILRDWLPDQEVKPRALEKKRARCAILIVYGFPWSCFPALTLRGHCVSHLMDPSCSKHTHSERSITPVALSSSAGFTEHFMKSQKRLHGKFQIPFQHLFLYSFLPCCPILTEILLSLLLDLCSATAASFGCKVSPACQGQGPFHSAFGLELSLP